MVTYWFNKPKNFTGKHRNCELFFIFAKGMRKNAFFHKSLTNCDVRDPFLENPANFSDPKSHLSNCNLHVLKSWSFNVFLMKNQEDCEVWRLGTPALRRYKGNYCTRNRLKSFGTFEKQAPGSWDVLTPKTHCMLWPPHDQVLTPFLTPYWINEGKKTCAVFESFWEPKRACYCPGNENSKYIFADFFLWFPIG